MFLLTLISHSHFTLLIIFIAPMAARVSMYSVGTTVKGFITKKRKDEIELNLEDGTIAIAQGDNASGMQFVY